MDNFRDETTFEVTVASDGVSTSGISSPHIVLDTANTNTTTTTLSWGINECSSSFQSVSSCETLESYEPTNTESPKVIVVPFLADNQVTGSMITNNGVHIPLIKECSIRIDPIKMTSTHSDGMVVDNIIELPFSTDATSDYSMKTASILISDDDSSPFLGFEVESSNGALRELYRKAVRLIKENIVRAEREQNSRYSSEPIVIDRDSCEPILTERILTERHFMERQPLKRNIKPETVKRPRQIQRKSLKPKLPGDQFASRNQSHSATTVITQVDLSRPSPIKQNNIMKPVVPTTPERVFLFPGQSVDGKNNKPSKVSDSSGSDSDVIPITPVVVADNSLAKKKLERSADIKNNNKEKEQKKLEKMRRRKELSWIAEKIRAHWKETFAAARRKQRKKEARRRKSENRTSHTTKYENHQRQMKRKRVSYSSDSDSTDSSSSSRTSCSSSSSHSDSNDSDPDTYTSDTSYTSQTSYTRSESDSSDTNSSAVRHRYRRRHNRYRRSPSETSDTSETSSSDDDEDDDDDDDDDTPAGRYVKRRKFPLMEKTHRKPSTSDEDCPSSRKRKSAYRPHRSEEFLHRKQRKMRKRLDREEDEARIVKNRTITNQKQRKFNAPSTSSAAMANQFHRFADRLAVESTSAGAFSVQQCNFN